MIDFIFGFTIGMVIGVLLLMPIADSKAVKHGCGEYNKTTGNFQWKDR